MTVTKKEIHIVTLPESMDPEFTQRLGEMVIAFGRLEDMLKVCIKRLEGHLDLHQVITDHSDPLGALIRYCNDNHGAVLASQMTAASSLNVTRQDFIHATIAEENGKYVRFRKLKAYQDLRKDIQLIEITTYEVNNLVLSLNQNVGTPPSIPPSSTDIEVSAASYS